MAAVLASLVPTMSNRVYAQAAVYYNPYGQGPYGEYSQGYPASSRAKGNTERVNRFETAALLN